MTRDANGHWTKYDYDDQGRQWRVRAFINANGNDGPDTINTITSYDLNGNQVWVLDPTQFEVIKDGLPQPPDATAWRAYISADSTRLTRSTYDNFGRVTQVDLPSKGPDAGLDVGEAFTTSKYDDGGRRWLQVDADGKATAYVYDGLGRLTWVITDVNPAATPIPNPLPANWPTWSERLADSTATHYTYDDLGQMDTQTDGKGHITTFEYDELGRRTARTLPGHVLRPDLTEMAARETWAYDYSSPPPGEPRINKVRHLDLNGRYSLTTYDLSGRVIERKPDGSESWAAPLPAGGDVPVTMSYNGAGQRASMNDASGETHYAYDDQSRLRIKQSPAGTLYYTYDDAGNITQISAQTTYTFASPTDSRFDESRLGAANARPEGAFMSYTYDGRNRLSQAYRDAAHSLLAAGYTYAAAGELQSIAYGNATTTTFDYNARKQLRRVRAAKTADPNTPLASFDYDDAGTDPAASVSRTWGTQLLSATGRRNRLSEDVRSITKITDFSYDNLNRLASESAGGSAVTYDAGPGYEASGYDEVGNRRSRAISGAGFPGVDTQAGLVYDKNDRDDNDANPDTPSTYFDGNGNRTSYDGWSYLYDFENHLITATTVGTVVSIIYDGDGNRVKKMVNGLTTAYLVDDRNPTGYSQVLEEQPDFGAVPETTYFYGLDLVSQTFRDSNGQTSTHYYGYDAQGTVRYLTSDTTPAAITDTYSYDAFGILMDEWTDGSTSANLYRYTGEQWDQDLGMYYLRARYYKPELGRFWTMDTFEADHGEPLNLHKYLYCQANPLNGIDPLGQFMLMEFLVSTAQRLGIAAPTVVATINVANSITFVLFEITTGETLIGAGAAGGAVVLGKAALSKVLGGVGAWKQVLKVGGSRFGPKAYLSEVLRYSEMEANHLNQSGAYIGINPEAGACIALEGKASVKGTEHNQFHAIFERFWDLFRKNGRRYGEKPTNREVLTTLRDALRNVKDAGTKAPKFTQKEIDTYVDFAEKEQMGNGYHDGPGGRRPEIPGSTNANK